MNKKIIQYQYALDEKEELVTIDKINPSTHIGRRFICIGCGRDMEAAMGDKRQYFRHVKNVCPCPEESYVHKLAKLLYKAKFDNSASFSIQITQQVHCKFSKDCKFVEKRYCQKEELHSIDLKKYYDTCSVEKEYKGYRADLLLENSKRAIPPIFIEFKYKHKCTDDKLSQSFRIIEIDCMSEDSVVSQVQDNIIENDKNRFYNFNRVSSNKNYLGTKHLSRYILFPEGKLGKQIVPCSFLFGKVRLYKEAMFEGLIDVPMGYIREGDAFLVIAKHEGHYTPTCRLCTHRKCSASQHQYCNLSLTRTMPFDLLGTSASRCPNYRYDISFDNQVFKDFKTGKIREKSITTK